MIPRRPGRPEPARLAGGADHAASAGSRRDRADALPDALEDALRRAAAAAPDGPGAAGVDAVGGAAASAGAGPEVAGLVATAADVRRLAEPSAAWRARGRADLERRLAAEPAPARGWRLGGRSLRGAGGAGDLRANGRPWRLRAAGALAAVLLLVAAADRATAGSRPGEWLWPLRAALDGGQRAAARVASALRDAVRDVGLDGVGSTRGSESPDAARLGAPVDGRATGPVGPADPDAAGDGGGAVPSAHGTPGVSGRTASAAARATRAASAWPGPRSTARAATLRDVASGTATASAGRLAGGSPAVLAPPIAAGAATATASLPPIAAATAIPSEEPAPSASPRRPLRPKPTREAPPPSATSPATAPPGPTSGIPTAPPTSAATASPTSVPTARACAGAIRGRVTALRRGPAAGARVDVRSVSPSSLGLVAGADADATGAYTVTALCAGTYAVAASWSPSAAETWRGVHDPGADGDPDPVDVDPDVPALRERAGIDLVVGPVPAPTAPPPTLPPSPPPGGPGLPTPSVAAPSATPTPLGPSGARGPTATATP